MAKTILCTLEGTDIPSFEVLSFRGAEALSTPFRYAVTLGSTYTRQDFDALLEAKAHLELGNPAVHIRGMLASVQQGYEGAGKDDSSTLSRFEIVIVPTIWKLTLTSRTRIFQEMSVPDIVKKILNEAEIPGDETDWRLGGTHDKKDFVLQYQESDLDFIHRLMEGEGIHYHFDHGDDVEKIVFGDKNAAFKPITGDPDVRLGKPDITIGETGVGPWGYEQTNTRFQSRQRVVPKKLVLQDYNFRKTTMSLFHEEEFKGLKALHGTQYYYGENYAEPPEGKAIGTLRKEEILARRRVFFGAGNVRRFLPGATYTQVGLAESDSELSVEYVITDMTSEGSQPVQHADRGGAYHYANEFTCIPKSVEFRPERRTPWPHCGGVVHAVVCAAPGGGQYAHVDDRGRYKVKFLFDIHHDGDEDKASCWVRLIEPYVGANFGFHSPLLKGTEVLVAFENCDPDRPIIVGCAYNNEFPSPTNNNNHAQSHWRSAANNEIRYTDTQGSEEVYFHAQKDSKAKVENDEEGYIGHDEKLEVKNNRERKVGVDEKVDIGSNKEVKIGANKKEEVGGDNKVEVKGKHEEKIGGTMDLKVTGAVTIGFDAAETIKVGGKKDETVDGKVVETFGAAHETDVSADRKLKVGGKMEETVTGSIKRKATSFKDEASSKIEIKAGAKIKTTAGAAAEFTCASFKVTSSGAQKFLSGGAYKVTAAGAAELKAGGAVKIKGSSVDAMDGSLKVL